jgi:hypothetical protein
MDRRGFLKRLLGTAALVIATKVGIGSLTAEDLAIEPPFSQMPRGLAYLISKDSGIYQGIARASYGESE